jgi:hypothetical protein
MASTQTLEHLRMANHARVARQRLKREIKAGKVSAAAVIANPPDRCERMPLMEVLMAQVRWGVERTHKLCDELGIYERRPIGKLTVIQRKRIIDRLPKR